MCCETVDQMSESPESAEVAGHDQHHDVGHAKGVSLRRVERFDVERPCVRLAVDGRFDIGDDGRWSSTRVRALVAEGEVAAAAALLGRPHRVDGVVVHGDHRGRLLGFPTANLGGEIEGLIPADGVYAGWLVRRDLPEGAIDRVLPAAISIGTNPTFDGTQRRVEGYVLDRTDLELYGERISYEFVRRLRPTLRFDGMDPLIVQMHEDVAQCRQELEAQGRM